MKRFFKLSIIALALFVTGVCKISAKEMSIEELGKEVDKISPKAGYVYIIGHYAFTSTHIITQNDIMLASSSIKPVDPTDPSKMIIYSVVAKKDPLTFKKTGWIEGTPALGTGKLPEKIDIRYIDYHHIGETTTSNISFDLDNSKYETYKNTLKDALKFQKDQFYGEDLKIINGKVTGLLLQKSVSDIYYNEDDKAKFANARYFFAYVLEVPGATNDTTIQKTLLDGSTKNVDLSSFDVKIDEKGKTPGIVSLVAIDPTTWANSSKTITITVDLDGKGDYYDPTDYVIDLSKLKFEVTSEASVDYNENEISQADKNELTSWGYTSLGDNNLYEIKPVSGKTNEYKVTGKVVLQSFKANTWAKNPTDGYFIVYNIKKPDNLATVPEDVKVTVGEDKIETFGKDYFNDQGVMTVLSELNHPCENGNKCKITITVDWDGSGKEYKNSETITIDYSSLVFEKSSKFSIESVSDNSAAKQELESDFGWKEPDNYDLTFLTDGSNVKVTGLLTILDKFEGGHEPFDGDDATGYYLPFVINLKTNKITEGNNKTTVLFMHEGEDERTITADDFDGEKELYVLRHLHKDDTDRTFTVIVDIDGDGEEYAPYKLTVDLSELKLQTASTATANLEGANEIDFKKLTEEYGYSRKYNENLALNLEAQDVDTYKLTGKMKEQELNESVYGKNSAIGYFFDFTFIKPKGVDSNNAKISSLNDNTGSNIKKTFDKDDYDKDGNLTILKRFDPSTSCQSDGSNCKLYYSVDWDGADNYEYLPTIYTIDYSGVTFEKSSIFSVVALDEDDESQFSETGWYNTEKGYSVSITHDEQDPTKYHVSGVLPILEEDDWEDKDPGFDDGGSLLYYLGLGLKLANAPENYGDDGNSKFNVLFEHDAFANAFQKTLTSSDFDENQVVYILKALNPYAVGGGELDPKEKYFTITVDLDDGADEYAPYTVTVDYSNLKFQNSSIGEVDFDLFDADDYSDNSPEKTYLDGYSFDIDTLDEISIKEETKGGEEDLPSNVGIQGRAKQQTLKENTFKNTTGYFVPIKISVPINEDWFGEYKEKWTIILRDEDGKEKKYSPDETERNQGWVLVLFRLDENQDKITYQIDFDGEEMAFLPCEYTIDYTDVTFAPAHTLNFNGLNDNNTRKVWEGDVITKDMLPAGPKPVDDYHEFAYWSKDGGTEVEELTVSTENITLEPHWNLYSDKFIVDVLEDLAMAKGKEEGSKSDDFSKEFIIEDYVENSGQIKISVVDPTITISRLSDTSIPGAIAYILLKNEIQSVTLTINGESKEFKKGSNNSQDALKSEIKAGAKELYNLVLDKTDGFKGKTDTDVTLSALAQHDELNSFTLTVNEENLSDNVTLKKKTGESTRSIRSVEEGLPTSYVFTFESDIVSVDCESNLETAISGNAEEIFIAKDFSVSKPVEVNRDIVISGGAAGKSISADKNIETIFNSSANDVVIEHLTLKNASKSAVIISNGSVTTKDVTIEYDDSLPETVEAGIKVESGTLTASNMTFEKEHYNTPLVKAKADNGVVMLTDKDSLTALPKNKVEITNTPNGNDIKKDTFDGYNYYHNDSKNAKIYTTELITHEGGARLHFLKYNFYNELVNPITGVDQFNTFTSEGKVFTMYGYSKVSYGNLYTTDTANETKIPEGVTKKDELRATSDEGYWVVYTIAAAPGAAEVTDKKSLTDALSKSEITSIYVKENSTIDMENETLEINNNVAIYSKSSNPGTIKNIGKITIKANDVSFNRINLEVNGQSGQDSSLIEVTGEKFSFWQGGLKNSGQGVDYAIKYTNEKSVVDVRYMGAGSNGFDATNINEAYIYVAGKITDGSDLYLNNFRTGVKGAIKINGFVDANKEDNIYGIRFLSNTVSTTDYAMKLASSVSGQEADIRFGKGKILVEYDDEHKQFSGINLLVDKQTDPTIVYQKGIGQEESSTLEGGSGITVSTSVQSSSPMETVINGLSQNDDGTYSGTITQAEDGRFYLPLIITSNQLKDRKSKVKITDPNEKTTEYLYTSSNENGYATIANIANSWPLKAISNIQTISEPKSQINGTMKINLEALKASKAKGGKVYNIAFDYDGDGEYDEPQAIDYNAVKTEEEIILEAVQNTKNANSFTITKDNNIKGAIEKYTFKNDLENGNKYYTEGQDNSKIEQYSFKASSVGLDSDVIYVVEKSNKINAPIEGKQNLGERPKLNEWTYFTHFNSVSSGTQELGLLTDIVPENDGEFIDAIATVSRGETEHTFNIKVNHVRLEKWLNGMYVDGKVLENGQEVTSESHDVDEDSTISLVVTLDNEEKYIISIKTTSEFDIKSAAGTQYKNNKIDVTFTDINNTEVPKPQELFDTTDDKIQEFIQKGKDWWHKYTGSTSVN